MANEIEIQESEVVADFSPVKVVTPSTIGYPGGGVKALLSTNPEGPGFILTLRGVSELTPTE